MSEYNDLDGVLHRFLTDDQAERLLTATSDGGESGVPAIASLFTAMRGAMTAEETVGSQPARDAFTTAMRSGGSAFVGAGRKPSRKMFLRGKAIAALATASLLTGGAAAAAATGTLPDPVQSSISRTLSHVGVDVPDPHDENDNDTSPPTTVAPIAPAFDIDTDTGKPDDTGRSVDAGNSGDAGRPDDAGNSISAGRHDDAGNSGDAGRPDDAGNSANAGQPDDAGKPADAGKPEAVGKPDKIEKSD